MVYFSAYMCFHMYTYLYRCMQAEYVSLCDLGSLERSRGKAKTSTLQASAGVNAPGPAVTSTRHQGLGFRV